jgi:hypothetical protein
VTAVSAALAADYAGAAPYSPEAASARAPTTGPGARCTATASIYDARDDRNNVYVHSNQPGQNATASAARYSRSYETNSSGYALIYLNDPPPGAHITVTVAARPAPRATDACTRCSRCLSGTFISA